MFKTEEMDDDEFLSLKLAMATNYDFKLNNKRKRKETPTESNSIDQTCEEGKIFALLQKREQMLNLNNKPEKTNPEQKSGLRLIHLLLISATKINENNPKSSVENLYQIYQNINLKGDSVQRVAAYFADGLLAKLLTQKSPFYNTIMKGPTPEEEFFAFTNLYKVSPFYQFAHFTANQAILEAFEKDQECNNSKSLHVIDFDVCYGFQWPSLMQSLSENRDNQILLRITGFGRSLEELLETESRLVSFAKGFSNLVFEFHGMVRGSNSKQVIKPKKNKHETVAVNLVFHLNSLNSVSKISETLNYVNTLSPSVVVLVEQEGSRSSHKFLPRFMESLHYFAAIFDSLDDCLPLDSPERLSIEKNHLGKEIKSVINCDKDNIESCPRFEKMETWKGRMENHGFRGIKQSSKSLMQAKLLLKIRSYCSPIKLDGENSNGFRVFERDEGKAISLGWQERFLITASSWCSSSV